MSIADIRNPMLDVMLQEGADNSLRLARRQGHDLAWEKNYFDEMARFSGQVGGDNAGHVRDGVAPPHDSKVAVAATLTSTTIPNGQENASPVQQLAGQRKGQATKSGKPAGGDSVSMRSGFVPGSLPLHNIVIGNNRPVVAMRSEPAMQPTVIRGAGHFAAAVSEFVPVVVVRGDGSQVKVWMRDRDSSGTHVPEVISNLRHFFMSMGLRLAQFSLNGNVYYEQSQPIPVVDEIKIELAE